MGGQWIAGVVLATLAVSRGMVMELKSPDIAEGDRLSLAQVYPDCGGSNIAPALAWSGAPAATKSFAVTAYDPDATGGWWHWIVFDLAPNIKGLPQGAAPLPQGARVGKNDFGTTGYGGACPPPGSGTHHYRFTVWALDVPSLPATVAPKGAAIGPYLERHALARATLTATYER